MSAAETAGLASAAAAEVEEAPAPEAGTTPAEGKLRPEHVQIDLDIAGGLHADSLAHDYNHRNEHRLIEEVVHDVTGSLQMGAQTPKTSKRASQERKLIVQEIDELVTMMDEKHVVLDLAVEGTDDMDAITKRIVNEVHSKGGLTAGQKKALEGSIDSHDASGKFYNPSMGHRLAIPLIYADLSDADGEPEDIVAFARLKTSRHLGEIDNEGILFVFVIMSHEAAEPSSPSNQAAELTHVHMAEALAFVVKEESTYDRLFNAQTAADVQNALKTFKQLHEELGEGKKFEQKNVDQFGNEFKKDKSGKVFKSLTEEALEWIRDDIPFGGIRRDLKRRFGTALADPYDKTSTEVNVYIRDWKDGMTSQSFAVVLFMFFACVAPAVAFGSLLDKGTGGSDGEYCKYHPTCTDPETCPCVGDIGVIEMLLSSGLCGVVYAIIGGSPLTVLGGTGPILVFTSILSKFAHTMEIDFLPFYAWTGLWVGVYSIILAACDFAVIIKKVTRFTDEIFSGLISLIFTISAILDLYQIHVDGKPNLCSEDNHDAAAFDNLTRQMFIDIVSDEGDESTLPCTTVLQLEAKVLVSVVLAGGTYSIAMWCRAYRKSTYTAKWLRNILADFGVALAIFCMVLVRELIFNTDVDLLKIPDTFEPTNGRDWFVGLGGLPTWAVFVSMFPALMGIVLVWLDNNITYRLVNSPDHKLYKGCAYHWDTAVTGIFIAVCSLFGLPWLVAATVRSLLLCKSLADTEDRGGRTRIIKVNENRFTCFAIHALVICAVFLPKLLQKIPLPVIFGLFLYMGVSSMAGNTMWERASLMFIWESEHQPSDSYMSKVPHKDIIKFTIVQLVSLAVLYVVKSSAIGISCEFYFVYRIPLFIAILPLIRHYTGKWGIVDEKFCEILDPEDLDEDEHEDGA